MIYHRGDAAQIVETPLKLFEYMAAGKAIVAPAMPNMQRILSNEVNALLIPPDNPEALANAFCRLLDQPALRQSLGTSAQSDAFKKHSWNRAVLELENVFYRQLSCSTALTSESDNA